MTLFTHVFLDLKYAPEICLMILFMFRIYCIQFAQGTRRGKQRAVEEGRKARQSIRKSTRRHVEEVIGVRGTGIGIGMAIVFSQVLRT